MVGKFEQPMHERRKMSEPLAQPAPVPHAEPEPVAAMAETQHEEPSLFETVAEPRQVAEADDGLPPPAYRPEAEQPAPAASARPAPGTPTPEALARLERVTGRRAGAFQNHVPGEARYGAQRPTAEPETGERPRFGINTLINRMSGSAPGETARHQPPVSREEPAYDEDQERIEIPAFLRRQAN